MWQIFESRERGGGIKAAIAVRLMRGHAREIPQLFLAYTD